MMRNKDYVKSNFDLEGLKRNVLSTETMYISTLGFLSQKSKPISKHNLILTKWREVK